MNSIGVFKMEIDPATHCQAYIDFQLVAAKQRKKKGEAPDQKTPAPKVLVPVDSRRLYVKKIGELDQCKRVVFSDCEYFSFLDVRLDSAYLGTKFRIHNEQLL